MAMAMVSAVVLATIDIFATKSGAAAYPTYIYPTSSHFIGGECDTGSVGRADRHEVVPKLVRSDAFQVGTHP